MGGGYGNLSELGGLIIWLFKGFKGKYSDYKYNKCAFLIGLSFIIIVLLLVNYWVR